MNIIEAINDKNLFASWFKDPETWTVWMAFLKALYALPLTAEELSIYRVCTGRQKYSSTPILAAWVIVSRRGGKTFIVAVIVVHKACFIDYSPYLTRGERGVIMCIAADKMQASVLFGYIRALLHEVPMLSRMIVRETGESIELSNGITIMVKAQDYRTVRGFTVVAAVLDEVAFWRDESSVSPDKETVAALRPAMATIPNALLIGISSPYARRGVLYEAYKNHYGRDEAPVLVWQADTRTMNPTIPEEIIQRAYQEDPISAASEYGAQFRQDIESFVSVEVIESCILPGIHELPYEPGKTYVAFCDPSGGSADSFTLAIAGFKDDIPTVYAIRELRPPFSPEAIVGEFSDLLKQYHISKTCGDRYGGEWPREQFRKHGIDYEVSERTKSDIYRELLPLLNARRVFLLDNKILLSQLVNLERRVARGGRDSIVSPCTLFCLIISH